MANWPYWAAHANAGALAAPVTRDVTTVMDIGIILGAMTAAALAGRYAPVWKVPARSLIAAVVGGLLLGYGARLVMVVTSAPISAASCQAACMAGYGWSPPSPATCSAPACARCSASKSSGCAQTVARSYKCGLVCNWGRTNLLHL